MNRQERLCEVRRLLEREPSVQRRWVWECREKILEYLIGRYGDESFDSESSDSYSPEEARLIGPRKSAEGQLYPGQLRLILEDIARLNEHSRMGKGMDPLKSLRN